MKDLKPIRVQPSLDKRPVLSDMDDVRREIAKTPKPDIFPDKIIKLGPCGMGMPVLQSHRAIREMRPGEILQTESGHI